MGFGFLFLGYLIAYITSLVGSYPFYLIGFILILMAVGKLRLYKRTYTLALFPLVPLMLICIFEIVCYFSGRTDIPGGSVLIVVFQVMNWLLWEILLFATAQLAGTVGLEKKRVRAVQLMVLSGLYFLLVILQSAGMFASVKVFPGVLLCVYLIVSIMCLFLYGSCYRLICPEGDENMPRKPSRFGWLNRFHEELDRREREATEDALKRVQKKKQRKKK